VQPTKVSSLRSSTAASASTSATLPSTLGYRLRKGLYYIDYVARAAGPCNKITTER
jgi:hypothetical protein